MTAETQHRRSHTRLWIEAAIGVVVLAVAMVLVWYVRSPRFADLVRRKTIATVEEATGGRVELRAFRWNLSPFLPVFRPGRQNTWKEIHSPHWSRPKIRRKAGTHKGIQYDCVLRHTYRFWLPRSDDRRTSSALRVESVSGGL